MKIDAGGVTAGSLQPEWSPKSSGSGSASIASAGGSDHTTLSSDSTMAKSLVAQALSMPDVRQERVQALRQAVSSGTYQVDPQKLATAMMSDS